MKANLSNEINYIEAHSNCQRRWLYQTSPSAKGLIVGQGTIWYLWYKFSVESPWIVMMLYRHKPSIHNEKELLPPHDQPVINNTVKLYLKVSHVFPKHTWTCFMIHGKEIQFPSIMRKFTTSKIIFGKWWKVYLYDTALLSVISAMGSTPVQKLGMWQMWPVTVQFHQQHFMLMSILWITVSLRITEVIVTSQGTVLATYLKLNMGLPTAGWDSHKVLDTLVVLESKPVLVKGRSPCLWRHNTTHLVVDTRYQRNPTVLNTTVK